MAIAQSRSEGSGGPLAAFDARIAEGQIGEDEGQRRIAERLEALHHGLIEAARGGPFAWARRLLNGRNGEGRPRGLYIHGDVGRGKSMLMDLFFASAPVERKRRVHFHEFMLEVHAAIHAWRGLSPAERAARKGADDPLPPVAREIGGRARLLCFDEFQVKDVADAMILSRLFTALLDEGVVLVATSNAAPERLYENGLNRALFLPFIDLLYDRLDVVHLDGPRDYRLVPTFRVPGLADPEPESGYKKFISVPISRLVSRRSPLTNSRNSVLGQRLAMPCYHIVEPGGDHGVLDAAFAVLAGQARGQLETLRVSGRKLRVPEAANGVARFSFSALCGRPLGAADYLAIARRYHTLVLSGVPRLGPERRNEARRFITLIDALYETKATLVLTAEAPPDALYPEGDGARDFLRTASRLHEMQSKRYLSAARSI